MSRCIGLSRFLLLALAGVSLTACVTTKPYQRGTLAEACMAPDADGDRQALRTHMLSTRAGAVGGFGGGGGGCGCN